MKYLRYLLYRTRLLTIIPLFLFLLPAFAQDASIQQKKDLLLYVINTREGSEKLEAYTAMIHFLNINEPERDSVIKYCNLLDVEAGKQGKTEIQGMAKSNALIILSNAGRYKEVIERESDVLNFLTKNNLPNRYYSAVTCVIEAYLFSGEKEKALDYAHSEYEKAKESGNKEGMLKMMHTIAQLYTEMNRSGESLVWLEDILEASKDFDKIPKIKMQAYYSLANAKLSTHNTAGISSIFDDWKKDLDAYIIQVNNEGITKTDEVNYYIKLLHYYNEIENYDKTLEYASFLEEFGPQSPRNLRSIHGFRTIAYLRKGEYKKAFEENEKLYAIAEELNLMQNKSDALRNKAVLLSYLNKPEESETAINNLIAVLNEMNNEEYNAQLNELRTVYEVDKLTAEKEIRRQQLIIALGGCAFLIIIVVIYIIYSRRLRLKNRNLYDRVQELSKKEKAVEQCLLKRPDDTLTKELQLFKKVSEYMHTQRPFANPDMNRKTLADAVGSNEKYLADAIRMGTGDTFSDYISNLRLQYALDLLNNQPEQALDSIALDSGYGSYSQFFRSFSKKYGISPSEYRKLSTRLSVNSKQ